MMKLISLARLVAMPAFLGMAGLAAVHSAMAQVQVGGVFQRYDKNGDGRVTPDELPDVATFARFDSNKDGVITLAEYVQVAGGRTPAASTDGVSQIEAIFKRMDLDGDGKLTRAEVNNAPWFEKLDRQGRGFVTIEQVRVLGALLDGRGGTGLGGGRGLPGKPEDGGVGESPRQGPKVLKASECGVRRLVPNLGFIDIDGKFGTFSNFKTNKALVIALTSTSCPIARKYAPSLARLEREFAASGVAFLLVNPTATDSLDSIRTVLKDNAFAGRYVHDGDGRLSGALGAQTTTEVFVLDAARTLVFRGAVDDQYGLGYSLDAPRQHFLKAALTAVLEGNAPIVAATEAPGCGLEAGNSEPAISKENTYFNRISRIVQNNCLECHRAEGVAPFSLATYEDVKSHAGMIRKQVDRGAMPPWFAAPSKEGAHSPWANDRSLSPSDKASLLGWIANGMSIGNPADAPLARAFPAGWKIGTPDLVVQLPRAVQIKATGTMPYQMLTAETRLSEDKWIQAYEVHPTAREVVHHVIIKVRDRGARLQSRADGDAADEREGYFAIYVPGNDHAVFPDGFARKLPAGATVSFQIHYTPNGTATTDQMKLGFVFAKEPPRHTIHVAGIANAGFSIPPGASNHEVTAQVQLPFDTMLMGFMPHSHLRGKSARYEATLPDGARRLLLDVPHYDFNWQLHYQFAEPVRLPRGTTLTYTAYYDNSTGNPANPDPTRAVQWGPQTHDEMALGYVEYYVPGQKAPAQLKGDNARTR
jgi:Ca2+-binding EF-hand superfamily protein